jgi:DNA polymerase phi
MTTNILPIFWNLASSSKDTRIPASAELISSLEGFQRSYLETKGDKEDSSEDEDDDEKDDEDDDEEDSDAESGIEVDGDEDMDEAPQDGEAKALDKALDKENADDVVYAVKRLIRGLGSSRDSSRLGFAVALTEVSLSRPLYIAKLMYSFWPVYHPFPPHKLSPSSSDHLKPPNPTKAKKTETSFSHVFSVLQQS